MPRAIKNDGGKTFRRVKRPLLAVCMQEKRRERCGHLLNDLKSNGNHIVILSDEKNFMLDPVANKEIDRVVSFGQDVSEVRKVSMTKHLASEIMFGVVASDGQKMPTV